MASPKRRPIGTYAKTWAGMTISPSRQSDLKQIAAKIAAGRKRYEAVERATGVPWWFAGIVHMREASCSWAGYLGNGQSWKKCTTKEPFDRGPFNSWEEGAADALNLQAARDKWTSDWSLTAALFRWEGYLVAIVGALVILWVWRNR